MSCEIEQNRKFFSAINLILSCFIFVVFLFSLVSIRLSLSAYLADNYPSPWNVNWLFR